MQGALKELHSVMNTRTNCRPQVSVPEVIYYLFITVFHRRVAYTITKASNNISFKFLGHTED